MILRELYPHNDKMFVIKRKIPIHNFIKKGEDRIKDEGIKYVQAWRDILMCDHVLQSPTHFLFCESVEDVIA
tara:strand:+ start:779 stop:994 length:216 start_codon:yes stop_codon:yes gene_type:complete